MKTLRFKVGDLARVVNPRPTSKIQVGDIAEVLVVGHFCAGAIDPFDGRALRSGFPPCDYICRIHGETGFWYDENLSPLPGDSDSRSHIHADTLKLFDQKPNTDLPVGPKVKERV